MRSDLVHWEDKDNVRKVIYSDLHDTLAYDWSLDGMNDFTVQRVLALKVYNRDAIATRHIVMFQSDDAQRVLVILEHTA